VIGLGEATHGSREFGDLRLMLTRYLVEHHGFRLVALEASVSRLAVLDRYVHGAGEPDSITTIVETGWIGRRALRELVVWLRQWNERHPGDPVQLLGLDPQENEIARRDLRDLIARAYPQAVERYTAVERELAAADSQASVFGNSNVDASARLFLREIVALGETDAPAMMRLMDPTVVRAGLEAAHLLLQFAEFNAGEADSWSRSRDWYMAVNLLEALESAPQTKAVVWAHNAHVAAPTDRSTASQPMGSWLRATLGCRYGALAVTFGQGAFVAQIPNDLEDDLAIDTLPRAPDESIEGILGALHETGTLTTWPCETSVAGVPEWLQKPQRMHWVGALFTPGTDPSEAFRLFRLVNDFDGIAFIPIVTADEMPTDRPLVPARHP
jgi:erythromycin esterase